MNDLLTPALILIPEKALGGFLMLLIALGGMCLIVGKKQQAKTLIVTAIAVPLLTVVVEAVCNELFSALPPWLIKPVSWLILIVTYLLVFASVMRLLIGKEAWDKVKAKLASDAIKSILKFSVSKWMLPFWAILLLYVWW